MRPGAVVVSFDSREDLPACLDALLAGRPEPVVVVVDNASTDGSAELVRERYAGRVRLVALERNTGFAGGCNRGLEALPAEVAVVAFMNPDVVVEPDCLARCAAELEADAALAGVAPRLMRPGGEIVDSVGQGLRRWTLEVRDRGYGRPPEPALLSGAPVLAACGALAVYRRDALAAVARDGRPWAEEYFCFWEDLELGWRLYEAGFAIRTCPEAVAVHRRGGGAAAGRGPLRWRRPPALEACVITNRWMTLARHLHPLDLALRAPVLLAWDAAMTTMSVLRRPALALHVARRLPLVGRAWRERGGRRRRLRDLPW